MHTYLHIIDSQGAHWLVGPNEESYFNGVVWVQPNAPIVAKQTFDDVTIEEFLIILNSAMNYDKAL